MTQNNINLLLVDDDPADRLLVKKALLSSSTRQFIFSEVDDGIAAIEFLNQKSSVSDFKKINLILLDLNMPRMDGRETLCEIKKTPALREIPVVILTTSDFENDIKFCHEQGCDMYIKKPFTMKEFVKELQQLEKFW